MRPPFALVAFSLACAPALALGLVAPACIVPSISTGSADSGASPPASSSDSGAAVQGASCTPVSATVSLCQYISNCPSLTLNPNVFPQCGFHVHGDAIDPECLCGSSLCPIGNPTTCAEAAQLSTGDVNYDSVCQEATLGGCTSLGTSSSSGGSSGTSSACQACINNCDNVPSCIDACQC